MDKVTIDVDLKFECSACFARLAYQKQPHDCPGGEEDEGFMCDLELYNTDIYYTTEVEVDDGFFNCA